MHADMASLNLPKTVNIDDDFQGFNKDAFCIQKHYQDSIHKVLVPHGMIQDRITKLANDIFTDSREAGMDSLVTLCVLKGGYRFFADLHDKLSIINSSDNSGGSIFMTVDFIRLKSYENTDSTGDVKVIGGYNLETLKGKNVLVVEDIVDTGRTMKKLLELLNKCEPKSVKVACLARKRTPLSDGFKPDYVGFEVPNHFVIGYNFDYNENFRDLMHICQISQSAIEKYKTEEDQ